MSNGVRLRLSKIAASCCVLNGASYGWVHISHFCHSFLGPLTTLRLHGHRASEADGDGSARAENVNQTFNGSPGAHSTACKAKENVDEGNGASEPGLLEASDPSLDAVVVSDRHAGGRVEALAGKFGSLVDDAAYVHHAGEGVCEVHHEDGTDQADNAVEVGYGASDDECENPVAGAQEIPEDSALLLDNRGEVEDGLEHFQVNGLHADVEVHDDGDPPGEKSEDVTRSLEAVWVDDVHDIVGRVLAVEGVDVDAEEHVNDADEGLGEEHALPEVQRVSHFREEGDEEQSAGVRVDHSVDSVECSRKTRRLLLILIRGNSSKDLNGLDGLDKRRPRDGGIVRRKVGSSHHTIAGVGQQAISADGRGRRTYQMMKLTMFIHTAAFEIHPIFLKLRMNPPSIPTAMITTIMATKQTLPLAICSMFKALLKIKMATVKNCWSDWATLMKWRMFTPKRRKNGSPKLCIGYRDESRSRKVFQITQPPQAAKIPKMR